MNNTDFKIGDIVKSKNNPDIDYKIIGITPRKLKVVVVDAGYEYNCFKGLFYKKDL